MCLERKHVEYLNQTNEADFQEGKISYETYVRFDDITERCLECELCGNGIQGDILGECRTRVLRLFISMKRDAEARLHAKAAPPPPPAIELKPRPSDDDPRTEPASADKQAANG